MSFETVFRELNRARVRYLVVGGIAVNLHGVPRATGDIDLVLALDKENIEGAVAVLQSLGFRPRAPVSAQGLADEQTRKEWREEKGMKAFSFHHPGMQLPEVDIVLDLPIDFAAAWERRVTVRDGDLEIPVVALEDLVAMKRGTGRAQDESDVLALEDLHRGDTG